MFIIPTILFFKVLYYNTFYIAFALWYYENERIEGIQGNKQQFPKEINFFT